jgi:hypothetical protein
MAYTSCNNAIVHDPTPLIIEAGEETEVSPSTNKAGVLLAGPASISSLSFLSRRFSSFDLSVLLPGTEEISL